MKVNRSIIIRGSLSLIFVGLLVSLMLQDGFMAQVRQIDPFWFAASLVLSGVMVSASTWKWKVLLHQQQADRPFGELFKVYLIGYYFSNLLPSNFGGDVVRSYYIGRRLGDQEKVAVTVFLERFTGLVLLLTLVILMPWLAPEPLMGHPLFWIPAVVATGLLFLATLAWCMNQPSRLPRAFLNPLLKGLSKVPKTGKFCDLLFRTLEKGCSVLDGFHDKLTTAGKEIRQNPRYAWPVFFLTLLFYGFTLLNVYICFRAFGVEPHFLVMACVVPTAMMVSMLPVGVLGNIGFLELTYIGYFTYIGLDKPEVLAMSLLLRIKMLLLGLIGLPLYLSNRGEVDRIREQMEEQHD